MGFHSPGGRTGEAGSVAALRETLRIATQEHASERREASRRLSQQVCSPSVLVASPGGIQHPSPSPPVA